MNKLMKNMKQKKKKGFTLIELIIVIAIIAVLAAMAIPKFGQVVLDSKISSDIATAKNIQTGVAQLVADGTIKYSTTIDDASLEASKVPTKVDGNLTPKALTGGKFSVAVSATGDIVVKAGTTQLAPVLETTKEDYQKAISGK